MYIYLKVVFLLFYLWFCYVIDKKNNPKMHGMSIKNNKMTSHTGMSNAPRVM